MSEHNTSRPKMFEIPEGVQQVGNLASMYGVSEGTIRRWSKEGRLLREFGWRTHKAYCPVRQCNRWWFTRIYTPQSFEHPAVA